MDEEHDGVVSSALEDEKLEIRLVLGFLVAQPGNATALCGRVELRTTSEYSISGR